MRFVFLIPLLGVVVFCAPVQDDQERKLVKRDDEQILFGNQQNPPKTTDNIVPGAEDSKGQVVATPAKPIEPETDVEESKEDSTESEEQTPEEPETESTETEETAETETPLAVNDESNNESADEPDTSDITPENEGAIQELESLAGNPDSEAGDNDVAEDVNMIPESAMASYTGNQAPDEDAYRQYRMYQFLMNEYPSMLDRFSGDNLFGSRRRRAAGNLLARLKAQNVKRSHRAKRDLPYDIDLLSQLYSPELETEEALSPYTEEEVELENDPYVTTAEEELEVDPYDEIQEIMYGGEPGYFIPSKSRDNYVPTSKRDSYFYPQAQEPYTHYSAFLADKRDYLDTYGNLVRLARALAMQPEDRETLLRGYEWE